MHKVWLRTQQNRGNLGPKQLTKPKMEGKLYFLAQNRKKKGEPPLKKKRIIKPQLTDTFSSGQRKKKQGPIKKKVKETKSLPR